MTEDSNNIELPSLFQEVGGKIIKWEMFEKEYHELINSKVDQFIKNSELPLQKKVLSSLIIACTDGIFIIREANKHNSSQIITSLFHGNAMEARKEFDLKELRHVKISDKARFYSLDYFDYSLTDNYNVKSEALSDFQILVSNNNLQEDNYIRFVTDVIELGINKDFERGQLIFRGQLNDEWELIPKLLRNYQEDLDFDEIVLCETLLLGKKGPYLYTYDPIDLLINFQHFGIPTRLLDWTSDLLIALFFACYDEKEEFNNKDGNLFAVERYLFTPFKINSSENNALKQPIDKVDFLDRFKKRLITNDIHVFEPVIKNPRMRIQDGCFMFFPFVPLNVNENKFVSLHDYMRAKNNFIDQENEKNENKIQKIAIRNVKIDKRYKKSILNELNEIHGISKQSLFVDNEHIKIASKYYSELYEMAKNRTLWFKTRSSNELEELRKGNKNEL